MDELRRLLDVVRRTLDADDARAEVGGRDPDDARVVWAPLAGGWRVCAVFREPPHDAEQKRERLAALVAPFEEVAARAELPGGGLGPAKQRELDEELDLARSGRARGRRWSSTSARPCSGAARSRGRPAGT
ncbi:MAG: hypothetical protein M5U28_50675 [Sandaracinaceae bacterium]|nr:hypothetical protein [Sandaracinaceae bacterium]